MHVLFSRKALQLLTTLPLLAVAGNAVAELAFSDFSFGAGTPFSGSTTVGGVGVTLTSSNTQPFGTGYFGDTVENYDPAFVTFTFDRPVTTFSLDAVRVDSTEYLSDFSIGAPTSLTGSLVLADGKVTTTATNDFGEGRLEWTGLSTTSLSFVLGNYDLRDGDTGAIVLTQFGVTAVPEPAALALMLGGLGLIAASARKPRPGR